MTENSTGKVLDLQQFLNEHKKPSRITVDKVFNVHPEPRAVDEWFPQGIVAVAEEKQRMKFLEDQLKALRMEIKAANDVKKQPVYHVKRGKKRKTKTQKE